MRDIKDYSEKYSVHGFEEYKVLYRRKKLLEIIEGYKPQNILEIGCGKEPLFQYVENTNFTIVEPSTEFCENAMNLTKNSFNKVEVINGFFEDVSLERPACYDMIICSSLLHEVENPQRLLKAIIDLCSENTIVSIVVPNANSMHRLLGREMGILDDIHDMSQNNIEFQQNMVFDRLSLRELMINNGLVILDEGGFFVKPFSHSQMYEMMQAGILNEKVLDGLNSLGNDMIDFASELYVNCKIKSGEVND